MPPQISEFTKKSLIVAVGIVVILVATLFYTKKNNNITPEQGSISTNAPVVQVVKTSGNIVEYSIENKTNVSIWYWPNTCASQTVKLASEAGVLVEPRSSIICMLAPEPVELKSNASVTAKLDLSLFKAEKNSGKYRLAFTYGEVEESFRLANPKTVYSVLFSY